MKKEIQLKDLEKIIKEALVSTVPIEIYERIEGIRGTINSIHAVSDEMNIPKYEEDYHKFEKDELKMYFEQFSDYVAKATNQKIVPFVFVSDEKCDVINNPEIIKVFYFYIKMYFPYEYETITDSEGKEAKFFNFKL